MERHCAAAGAAAARGGGTLMMLTLDDVRDAVEAGEWTLADSRLASYNARLRALFEGGSPPTREQCLQMMAAQRDFIAELAAARDHVGMELSKLQRESRGVRAYLGA